MKFTYTEYYDDQPGKERMNANMNQNIKDPVEIVIRIQMDAKKYEARKAKYKEPIWVKIGKLFGV